MVKPFTKSDKKTDVLHEESVHATRCYLYEEQNGSIATRPKEIDKVFTFQYWPEEVQDSYTPNYNEVPIPGGSHPLYQYVGGGAREISFRAVFTAEEREAKGRIGDQGEVVGAKKYSVDIVGALAKLQRYLYPKYDKGGTSGVVRSPPKLVLVMPGTNLGRNKDEVLVILRGASVSYTHWYPDGTPRIAAVDLQFNECVQTASGNEKFPSNIQFIGSDEYFDFSRKYTLTRFEK